MNESVESRLRKYRTAAPPDALRNAILSRLPARGPRRPRRGMMMGTTRVYPWQRWRRRAVFACLAVFVALPTALAGIAWNNQVALAREVQAIRAAGFPATPSDLNSCYPNPPKENNAAVTYQQSFAAMEKTGRNWAQENFAKDIDKAPRQSAIAAALHGKMREYLADNAEALRLLHEAVNRPDSRYPLDFSKGVQMLLPHLSKLRESVRLLRIEALVAAEDGDTGRALSAIQAALVAADSVRREPVLVSQLARIACHQSTVDTINRVLNTADFSDAQLTQLGAYLRDAEDPGAFTRAMAGDRAVGLTSFDHPEQFLALSPEIQSLGPGVASALGTIINITGMAAGDRRRYLAIMDEVVTASQRPLPEAMALMDAMGSRIQTERSWIPSFTDSLVPGLIHLSEAFARDAAFIASAETAVAVERYRLANGNAVPERLEQLAPAFLPAVPVDPFDGQPLRYQSGENGYTLNGVYQSMPDNGGNPYGVGQRGARADVVFRVDHTPPAAN